MSTGVADSAISELEAFFLKRNAWQSFTPTITQSVAITITVTYAKCIVLADTVILTAFLSVTSAGVAGNNVVITLPAAIQPVMTGAIGTGYIFDSDASGIYFGQLTAISGSDVRIRIHALASAAFVGINPNFALANGDVISFQAAYER